MRCLKLLCERIMALDSDRQIADLQERAAVRNRPTRFGTPITVATPKVLLQNAASAFTLFQQQSHFSCKLQSLT